MYGNGKPPGQPGVTADRQALLDAQKQQAQKQAQRQQQAQAQAQQARQQTQQQRQQQPQQRPQPSQQQQITAAQDTGNQQRLGQIQQDLQRRGDPQAAQKTQYTDVEDVNKQILATAPFLGGPGGIGPSMIKGAVEKAAPIVSRVLGQIGLKQTAKTLAKEAATLTKNVATGRTIKTGALGRGLAAEETVQRASGFGKSKVGSPRPTKDSPQTKPASDKGPTIYDVTRNPKATLIARSTKGKLAGLHARNARPEPTIAANKQFTSQGARESENLRLSTNRTRVKQGRQPFSKTDWADISKSHRHQGFVARQQARASTEQFNRINDAYKRAGKPPISRQQFEAYQKRIEARDRQTNKWSTKADTPHPLQRKFEATERARIDKIRTENGMKPLTDKGWQDLQNLKARSSKLKKPTTVMYDDRGGGIAKTTRNRYAGPEEGSHGRKYGVRPINKISVSTQKSSKGQRLPVRRPANFKTIVEPKPRHPGKPKKGDTK